MLGLGTFRPVKVEHIEEHHMHSEFYRIEPEEAEKINRAKESGHRIIAVGTTSCLYLGVRGRRKRSSGGKKRAGQRSSIYPGYQFKCIDALITNFHLPQSTLVMLVSALAGKGSCTGRL